LKRCFYDEGRAVTTDEVIQPMISYSPNPVSDFANVEYLLPGVRSWQKYGLYNIRGQKLGEGKVSGERGVIRSIKKKYVQSKNL
jgi:hypothetical protein